MNNDQNKPESNTRGGYPLLALFFAVAASAVLISLLAPIVTLVDSNEVSLEEFIAALVIGGVVGMIHGLFIGLYHYRRLLGAGLGILTGTVIGSVVGPVVLSPSYTEVMATCMGGSVLLLVLGFVCRILDPPAAS